MKQPRKTNTRKDISAIPVKTLRKFADYLEIPFVQVALLAELIQPSDLIEEVERTLEEQLEEAYLAIQSDSKYSSSAPSRDEWGFLSANTKIGIVMMWQYLTDNSLLDMARITIIAR